jgi:hypothetical protein
MSKLILATDGRFMKLTLRLSIATIAFIEIAAPALVQPSQALSWCEQKPPTTPDLQMRGCIELIDSGPVSDATGGNKSRRFAE